MADTVLAIDISIYTGVVTQAQMQAVKDAGYEGVVIGGWHGQSANRYAQQQELVVNDEIGVYILIAPPSWTELSPAQQVEAGLAAVFPVGGDPSLFCAIDCEVDITPEMIEEALDAVILDHGWRPIIYTGRWWWAVFIERYKQWFADHPGAFTDIPAWLADYDGEPILDTPGLPHLGPVLGKQFKGTTYEVGGINADLNVFDRKWFFGEEDDMTALEQQVQRLTGYLEEMRAMDAFRASFPLTEAELNDPDFIAEHGRKYAAMYNRVVAWRGPPAPSG